MEYKIVWLTAAIHELAEIKKYIMEQADEETASELAEMLYDSVGSLQTFPLRHQKDKDRPKFRRLVVTETYSVFYQVKEGKVYIAHIWHSARDKKGL